MVMIRPETEMKDSGVQWIGDIPNDWNIKPLYACLDEINQKNNPVVTTNILSLTNTDGVIPYSERGNQGNKSKENFEEYKVVYPNTIVANSMNILIGSVGLSQYEGCVSPVYYVYAAKPQVDIRYMNYLFQMELFQKRLRQFANGILEIRLRVSSHDILHQKVAVPTYDEQQAIADYLDKTSTKIDEIIAETKVSIDEYKGLKQSVIFEAVTKGLDKNVEMKGSGSYWIGDIPLTWSTIKTKYVIKIENGSDPSTEGDTPVYGSGANSFKTCGEYKVGPTVLLGRKGATLHIPHYIEGKYWNVDTAFNTTPIEKRINLKYFYYVAFCFDYTRYISQTTLPGMTQASYRNIYIPYPPMNVQNRIVLWLDNKIDELDSLIAEKESLINDLEAYKKSLIYEVVTGKRRVV
ncbi:MAG: restriction endonuclease subunit S [Catenibacterium mitsuokai]